VSGDPADVGRTPVGVLGLQVEDRVTRPRRVSEVAARRVTDLRRFARRPGGVDEKERVVRATGDGFDLLPPIVGQQVVVRRRVAQLDAVVV
jgi:hypothetical protein